MRRGPIALAAEQCTESRELSGIQGGGLAPLVDRLQERPEKVLVDDPARTVDPRTPGGSFELPDLVEQPPVVLLLVSLESLSQSGSFEQLNELLHLGAAISVCHERVARRDAREP